MMQSNNGFVGFALLIAVTVCAALMPWGAFHVAVDTPFIEGASLPVSVKAFGGHITFLGLIVPNWLATLLIVSSAVLGMTNAKGITTFPRGIVLAPLLIAAVHCLLIIFLLMRSEVVPRLILDDMEHLPNMERDRSVLGAGLLVTLLSAVCGAFMAAPVAGRAFRRCIAPGRSRLWITLTCYHLAAAFYLLAMTMDVWWRVEYAGQEGVDSKPSLWLVIVMPILVAGLVELTAFGLHRRMRLVWVASLALSLFFLLPPFASLFSRVPFPFSLLLVIPAIVCVYWGLLAPGTRAEFRKDRIREDPTQES